MAGRRGSRWFLALTVLIVLAADAVAVAIALDIRVSLDGGWPRWLDGVRRQPLHWAAGLTVIAAATGLVAGWVRRRRRARRPVVVKPTARPPDLLGIRPAIVVGPAPGRLRQRRRRGGARLPAYVPRDHDPALRDRLVEAARAGGLVLLVGAASTGKSRSAYEAVRAVLPRWQLLVLDPARGVEQLSELPRRTVLWVDEIRDQLTEEGGGLNRTALLTLIHRRGAVVLASTRPPRHGLTGLAGDELDELDRDELDETPAPDVESAIRDLLALAGTPVYVPDRLSAAERERAAGAAGTDPRIRAALDDPDVGFTQALAGAGHLVRHWRRAEAYPRAVIDAAVDCRRLGLPGPFDPELLRAGAAALLPATAQQDQVEGWFDRAIDYATRELPGGLRVLAAPPRASRWWRRSDPRPRRLRLADDVFEDGRRRRFAEPLPEQFLKTLVTRVDGGPDLFRLARALHARGLLGLAEQLYRRGGRAGHPGCRRGLALLLADQGEPAEAVTHLAEAAVLGDPYARLLRLRILHRQGDAATLAELAATDAEAAWRLAALLLARDDHDGALAQLRRLWRAGVYGAAVPLADLLAGTGRHDELAELAAADCIEASLYLLASEEAVSWRDTESGRAASAGSRAQSWQPYGDPRLRREWLADEVAQGRSDQAIAVLRELVAVGEPAARRQLCHLLHDLGRVDELRALAADGDPVAGWLLVDLLAARGRWRDLRDLAAGGNPNARRTVAVSLARQGRAADAARWLDLPALARILLANGHPVAARRHAAPLAASAVPGDRLLWARVRLGCGDREEAVRLLTALVAAGEVAAGVELVALAVADGSEAELRRLARCGVVGARRALRRHLVRTGRAEEADRVRVHGLHPDGSTAQ